MNQIQQAFQSGYSPEKILAFFANAYPEMAKPIATATKYGYNPLKILQYVSTLLSPGERVRGGTEAYQEKLSGERTKEKLGALGSLAGSSLALFGAGKLIPRAVRGAAQAAGVSPPSPSAPTASNPPGAPAQAAQQISPQPAPLSAQANSPTLAQANQQNPQGNAPISNQQITNQQPSVISPESVVKDFAFQERIKNLYEAGNNPEQIAAGLNASLVGEQRKLYGQRLKKGEIPPLDKLVSEYLKTQPFGKPPENPIKPSVKAQQPVVAPSVALQQKIQPKPEEHPILEAPAESDEEQRLYREKIAEEAEAEEAHESKRQKIIDEWDGYFKRSTAKRDRPAKSTKDFIREAKAQMSLMEDRYEVYSKSREGVPSDPIKAREMREQTEELQEYINYLQEKDAYEEYDKEQRKKLKKGDLVIDSESGNVANLEDMKEKKSLLKSDGKLSQVNTENLIPSPLPAKELHDLYDDLLRGIEKETKQQVSRNVNWAGYDPEAKELSYLPHDGAMYVYPISDDDIAFLTGVLHKRKTTGENFIGAWEEGSESPIGAGMSQLIQKLQKAAGGKGKEYSRKYQTLYSAIEPAVKASKNFKKKKKKNEG